MAGDGKPLADGAFLRFLLPSPKPAPEAGPAAPARLGPPHRLFAAPPPPLPQPRPDERLFIVPPTRPSWYPPPQPPPPVPPPRRALPAGRTDPAPGRARNAGRFAAGRGAPVRRRVGDFSGNAPRAGPVRRKARPVLAGKTNGGEACAGATARTEKRKVWVPVEKKGGNGQSDAEDQAAVGGGYAGGDEAEGSLEGDEHPEPDDSEQDGDGRLLGEEFENSLNIAGDHERPDDENGGEQTNENPVPQSNELRRLRVKMRGGWVECRHDIDAFAPGLLSVYESLKPSEEHKSKQSQLIDSLTMSVSKEWPDAKLHLYGSCANSFGTSHSDVDVCLEIDIGTGSAVEILLRLAEILRTDNFDDVEVCLHYMEFCNCFDVTVMCSKTEKNWTTRVGNDRHLMCIEDPFETGHDLGRVVDRQTIRIIREEFERAAFILQHDDDPCVTLFEPYNHEPESSKIP